MNKAARCLSMAGMAIIMNGCYYMQAARGQLEIVRKREPIEQVLANPDTSADIASKLQLVQDVRQYSIDVLGLPDNDSYRSYADLEREFVVWNIFAADEFSLDPRQWCYPVVGCVSYRGYFDEDVARQQAQKLAEKGYDVFVGGVAAYSTLGRFDDPVLNTMMNWGETQLVGVLFHELAHQVLYIKDDTGFNESFATAVEEFGVHRYLSDRGKSDVYATYEGQKAFRRDLMSLINAARVDLSRYYEETIDPDEMRLLKEHRIERIEGDIKALLSKNNRNVAGWMRAPFNNARLASFSLYEGHLPAFRQLLKQCADDLPCFYAEAKRVSTLKKTERDSYLAALATR